jgi:glycosyltransferase involved in cell wall biosynthesis
MLVDVIIPTHNRSVIMHRAIQSVLNQTYKDFILHIVNDGSTDDTLDQLAQYKHHPQVKLHSKANGGVSSARNFGATHASGKWLSFLDSDDEWLPNKLEVQIKYLKEHPQFEFIHSEEVWIRNNVRVNPKQKHLKSNENIFERSLQFCLISPSTVMLSRELFSAHQGFKEDLIVCEDYDLWLRILAHKKIAFIEEPLIKKYGGHSDQLSTKFVAMDYWRIKSLVNLYQNELVSSEQRDQIKNVLLQKSEVLLKSYIKYQNQKHFDEISESLSRIMLTVKT